MGMAWHFWRNGSQGTGPRNVKANDNISSIVEAWIGLHRICSASFLFFYRIKLAGKVKARRFRSPFTPPAIKERFHGGKRREQGPSERRTDLFREQVIDCTVRWTFEEQVLKGDAPAELLNIVVVGVSNSFWYIDEDMIYCTVHPARWCGRNIGQKSRRPLFSSHWNVQIWTDWQRQSVVRCNGTRVQGNEK